MNFGPLLFLGIFLTFAVAWIGMVFMPASSLKDIKAAQVEASAVTNPRPYTGQEQLGRGIYQREGCVYCHTQQIRGGKYNNDVERGWGSRRSHPQDYIYDYPVLLGTARTGPDLVNIAARQSNENWLHTHFYDPQLITPGSVMAPFSFLYTLRKIDASAPAFSAPSVAPVATASAPASSPAPATAPASSPTSATAPPASPASDALKFNFVFVTLSGDTAKALADLKSAGFALIEQRGHRHVGAFDPAALAKLQIIPGVTKVEPYVQPGYEIVPTDDAKNMVKYLKSLDHNYAIVPAAANGSAK